MIGAIIGDIAGSRFEFSNHKNKNFCLFTDECRVTDDSIMTICAAKAIMETEKTYSKSEEHRCVSFEFCDLLSSLSIKYMREIGQKYPDCGYGGMFFRWMYSLDPKPYNSFGNGAAMRVSPAGFAARSELEAIELSNAVTRVTHNHKEGINGAEAVAVSVFMAASGFSKDEIRKKIEKHYYPLNFTIDLIKDTYKFDATCCGTVPQAIQAFLESVSFEDAIRTAISLGGDSDTIAAITGAVSQAYYGVPRGIKEQALTYLNSEFRAIYDEWEEFMKKRTQQQKTGA